jgi:hypothetical protein
VCGNEFSARNDYCTVRLLVLHDAPTIRIFWKKYFWWLCETNAIYVKIWDVWITLIPNSSVLIELWSALQFWGHYFNFSSSDFILNKTSTHGTKFLCFCSIAAKESNWESSVEPFLTMKWYNNVIFLFILHEGTSKKKCEWLTFLPKIPNNLSHQNVSRNCPHPFFGIRIECFLYLPSYCLWFTEIFIVLVFFSILLPFFPLTFLLLSQTFFHTIQPPLLWDKTTWYTFLGMFEKLRKVTTSFFMPVHLSVCLHGTTRLPLDRVSWKFYQYFLKICQENSSFVKIW